MIILALIVFGLALGSFINALVWRVHQQSVVHSKKAKQAYSITAGRSMCPTCRHELAPLDLVPVLSWLWLRGRCRYCRAPIAWQYPVVELLAAALFVVTYVFWPFSLSTALSIGHFILWLIILCGLIALAVYDIKWFLLPNRIVFPLFALGIAQLLIQILEIRDSTIIVSSLGGVMIGGGIFWIIFQLSDGKWIGGGDVKLGWLLGLLLGSPLLALLMIFLASLIGTFVSLPLFFTGRLHAKTKLPFGPFLIIAALLTQLFGRSLVAWYKQQIGLY